MPDAETKRGATPKEARAALGINRQTMSNWNKKRWLIHFDDGSIDVDGTRTMVERYRNSAMLRDQNQKPGAQVPADVPAPAPAPEPSFVTYDEADRRLKLAQAQIAELKKAQLKGDLIAVEDARRVYVDHIIKARANIEAIPARVAAVLAGLDNPTEIKKLLEGEIERALTMLHEGDDD